MQQGFHIVRVGRTADDGTDTDLVKGTGSAVSPGAAFPQFSQDVFRDSAVVDGHKFIAAEPLNRSLLCQNTGADIGEMFQVGISYQMAILIVDGFETVQIHKQNGEGLVSFQKGVQSVP